MLRDDRTSHTAMQETVEEIIVVQQRAYLGSRMGICWLRKSERKSMPAIAVDEWPEGKDCLALWRETTH